MNGDSECAKQGDNESTQKPIGFVFVKKPANHMCVFLLHISRATGVQNEH